MSAEFGVTSGHSLYSTHRFREDTKHMVIFETLVKTDAFEPFQYTDTKQTKSEDAKKKKSFEKVGVRHG